MLFCPKCGSIMMPGKGNNGKIVVVCKCGYKNSSEESMQLMQLKETVKKDASVQVVEEGAHSVHVIVDATCKKCGHDKAFHWDLQTRSSDEPPTKFFQCEKCKYTWRDYK